MFSISSVQAPLCLMFHTDSKETISSAIAVTPVVATGIDQSRKNIQSPSAASPASPGDIKSSNQGTTLPTSTPPARRNSYSSHSGNTSSTDPVSNSASRSDSSSGGGAAASGSSSGHAQPDPGPSGRPEIPEMSHSPQSPALQAAQRSSSPTTTALIKSPARGQDVGFRRTRSQPRLGLTELPFITEFGPTGT